MKNKRTQKNWGSILFAISIVLIVFVVSLLIMSIEWFQHRFAGVDFATIMFTMTTSLEGAGNSFSEWGRYVFPGSSFCTLIVIFILVINWKVELIIKIGCKERKKRKIRFNVYRHKIVMLTFLLALLGYEIYNGLNAIGIMEYISKKDETTTIYEDYYVNPDDVKITFPDEKKNLILIYMESMDSCLSNIQVDGGSTNLIPELETLAMENVHFSDNDSGLGGGFSCYGTDWTMAALLSSVSGIPFDMPVGQNEMEGVTNFLPSLVTLGDILQEEGYQQEFMCGSEAEFGGRDLFYKQHGYNKIWDYNTAIEKKIIPEDYYEFWGIEDEKLLQFAKEEIIQLAEGDKPFNFTLLTVDTHFDEGYICNRCENTYSEQYANVYRCSSKLMQDFIEWIQQQDFYQNTAVVIVGDHPSMNGPFFESVSLDDRRTYNAFINTGLTSDKTNSREFTTFDYYPTILASLGVEIEGERLGFGTNLFGERVTIPEEIGMEYFTEEIQKNSIYYSSFLLGKAE